MKGRINDPISQQNGVATPEDSPKRVHDASLMWAQLVQHIHPDDTETQHSVRQNNGSVSSTMAAYQRAKNHCLHASHAFDVLASGQLLKQVGPLKTPHLKGDAIVFNGLNHELTSIDIHQDHYEQRTTDARNTSGHRFHIAAADFRALAKALPRLKKIEITCAALTEQFIEAMTLGLKDCPIEELTLHHCGLGFEDLLTLLDAWAPSLRTLDLSYNDLSDHAVGGLDLCAAEALEVLDLSHCSIDLADINLSDCTELRSVNLSSNLGGASFLMGHDLGAMPKLQVLQLNRTQLVGGSLSHLDLTLNHHLHTLDLGYNALRNDDMHKFALAMPCALRHLNVSGNAIGAIGFVSLQHKGIDELVTLDFADNDLSDYSRYAALSSPSFRQWPNLRTLDLAGCDGITKATLSALQLSAAARLQRLDLSSTQLHDDAFAALPWAHLHALRTFRAEFNHITQTGIRLAAFDACPSLVELDLQNHAMTMAECLQAFAAKPRLAITTLWLRNRALDGEEAEEAKTDALVQGVRTRLGPCGYLDV